MPTTDETAIPRCTKCNAPLDAIPDPTGKGTRRLLCTDRGCGVTYELKPIHDPCPLAKRMTAPVAPEPPTTAHAGAGGPGRGQSQKATRPKRKGRGAWWREPVPIPECSTTRCEACWKEDRLVVRGTEVRGGVLLCDRHLRHYEESGTFRDRVQRRAWNTPPPGKRTEMDIETSREPGPVVPGGDMRPK